MTLRSDMQTKREVAFAGGRLRRDVMAEGGLAPLAAKAGQAKVRAKGVRLQLERRSEHCPSAA